MKKKYYEDEDENFDYVESQETVSVEPEFGCGFCWDKRKEVEKELYFFDAANNLRLCNYCPNCGRKYNNSSY